MFAGWLGYLKYKNATIVDVAWTFGILGVTILYFVLGKVPYGSKYIILFAMFIWALRLGTLIIYRIIRFGVDGRYKALDKTFEVNRNRKYFFFFMFQGASLLIFTLPVLILVSSNKIYPLWSLMVTGIPPTEKQALLSKREAYIEYQRTTSVFVPWFKKK